MRIVWATTDLITFSYKRIKQCSGSVGSVKIPYVWASWILPSTSKEIKKNFYFYCFATSLWLFIFKNLENKKYFLLVSWRSLTKRAGSRSGSVSQIYKMSGIRPDLRMNWFTWRESCQLRRAAAQLMLQEETFPLPLALGKQCKDFWCTLPLLYLEMTGFLPSLLQCCGSGFNLQMAGLMPSLWQCCGSGFIESGSGSSISIESDPGFWWTKTWKRKKYGTA